MFEIEPKYKSILNTLILTSLYFNLFIYKIVVAQYIYLIKQVKTWKIIWTLPSKSTH